MLQCWRRTGHLLSFFVPTPGGFDSSRVPTPGNLPSKAKKKANARGSARGEPGRRWNWLMRNWEAQTYKYWRRARGKRNDVILTYTLNCEAAPRSLFLTPTNTTNYWKCVLNLLSSWVANPQWLFFRLIMARTQILIHARDFAHHTTVGISPKSHTVMTTGTPSSRVRIIVVMVAFIIIEIKTHTKKKKITRNK